MSDLLPGGVFVSLLLLLDMASVGMEYFPKFSNLTLQSYLWGGDYFSAPAG